MLSGMFLTQKKYAMELLDRAHMASCNPTRTPFDTDSKLSVDGDLVSDPTLYRSLAGANNDLNVLYGSPLFDDELADTAPECPFVFKRVQEAARKNIERAFGVLQVSGTVLLFADVAALFENGPSSTPGCDESTSRCQTTPSIRALGSHQPVIPGVPLFR
ncbi:ribonuclease H-like domain-containing protein [Tanacetum coccineum]